MSKSEATDEALMARAAAGDGTALAALYRRHQPGLRAYLRRFAPDRATAEDLVQETFVRVMRYAAAFDSDRSFRGWLYGIARNVGLSGLGRGAETVDLDEVTLAAPHDPGDAYSTSEALAALERALDALSATDREILRLARIEGRGYREVGRMLGITEGAVKVRVFRALRRLRTELRERGDPEGWLDER